MKEAEIEAIERRQRTGLTLLKLLQENADSVLRSWPAWVASLLLALPVVRVTAKVLSAPASYPEFIVGSLVWHFDGKGADYGLLLAYVAAFALSMTALLAIAAFLQPRVGDRGWLAIENLAAYCFVPAFIWLGVALIVRTDQSLWPLWLSSALIFSLLTIAVAAGARSSDFWKGAADQFGEALSSALMTVSIAPFSVIGFGIAFNKATQLFLAEPKVIPRGLSAAPTLGAAVALAAVLCIVFLVRNPSALTRRLAQLRLISQIGIPLLFLAVIPAQWIDAASGLYTPTVTVAGWVIPIILTLVAYGDLARGVVSPKAKETPSNSLSISCLVSLLAFLKLPAATPPAIPPDDYHFGEFIVPWWSYIKFGLVPFVDMEPARGIINYAQGLLSSLFLDGTPGSLPAANAYWTVIVLLVAFPIIAQLIGAAAAFLAFLLMPGPNGISEIDIYVTACLALICQGFLRWQPSNWLIAAFLICLSAVLFSPGQGGLLSLALAPLAFVALAQALRGELQTTLAKAGTALIVLGAAAALTPLGPMLFGAFRYGLEQSAINSVANGIAWSHSLGKTPGWNIWIREAFRASWIAFSGAALVVVIRAATGGAGWPPERRKRALAFAGPLFLLSVLFVIRAAGRIDPIGPTRLGIAGIWVWCLLTPLLLFAWSGRKISAAILVTAFVPAFILAPFFTGFHIDKFRLRAAAARARLTMTNGDQLGIPNLGLAVTDPAHLNRLKQTKGILDKALTADETYLDATNRGAQYFYFDRRPPISAIALYNAVSIGQQKRAIENLTRIRPPLALISSDSIIHDGGPAGLRTHLIYRYLLLHYTPAVADTAPQLIWMIENGSLNRIDPAVLRPASSAEERRGMLDRAFRVENLGVIPSSWGLSFKSLRRLADMVTAVEPTTPLIANSVTLGNDGVFNVTAPDPWIVYTPAISELSGRDAGLLFFKFNCLKPATNGALPIIEIYWTVKGAPFSESNVLRFRARNGRQIVPMDAFPGWLLAEKITAIRIDIADEASCKAFTISDVRLMQRRSVR